MWKKFIIISVLIILYARKEIFIYGFKFLSDINMDNKLKI